ncbi:MAG: hypothetical protein RIR48_1582 [Bacteroidota bacterium]|jgi:hypothetical protein
MNRNYNKIKHIQETNKKLEKRVISEGFVQEYTKDQAIASFKEVQNGQGTVSFDPQLNQIVFQVGPRKFFIKELQ